MATKIQIGTVGYRDENGKVYKMEPIYQESTPELEEGYKRFIQQIIQFFLEYFALEEQKAREAEYDKNLANLPTKTCGRPCKKSSKQTSK